jgi:glucokinase
MMKIGIDLGGTTMSVGVVSDKNEIIAKKEIETICSDGADKIIERMSQLVQQVMNQVDKTQISHIGIGCPGMLDRSAGRVLYSNNLGWENIEISEKIRQIFKIPVYIENDANCAALGEYIVGSGKDVNTMIMITLGTGIGGGIIIDNKLYRGKSGNSNILGHMLMVSDGLLCTCGRKGCWEAYASGSALIRMANQKAEECKESELSKYKELDHSLNGKNIFLAIHNGDKAACQVFEQYIAYVAEGITDIVNIFEPQMIVIGGGISQQGEFMLNPIRQLVEKNVYCGLDAMPIITTSCLGNDAGIIGASCLNEY